MCFPAGLLVVQAYTTSVARIPGAFAALLSISMRRAKTRGMRRAQIGPAAVLNLTVNWRYVFVRQACPAVQRMTWLQFLAGLVRTHQSATQSGRRDFFRLLPHLVLNLVSALRVECFGLALQILNLKVTLSRHELCPSLSEGGGLR